MNNNTKKVFISYRRANSNYVARSIFLDLRANGYDVFMDVENVDSGVFFTIILNQIEARPHFLIILTPGSLEGITDPNDWLRREIEHAIKHERNIVPVLAKGFSFDSNEYKRVKSKVPSILKRLSSFNAVDVPENYFEAAMEKLRKRFLKIPPNAKIKPTPQKERSFVKSMTDYFPKVQLDPRGTRWLWNQERTPLYSPTLEINNVLGTCYLKWTPVVGAVGYLLQKSDDKSFSKPIEIYRGVETKFSEKTFSPLFSNYASNIINGNSYYRVKAEAGQMIFGDSPWSNVVTDRLKNLFSTRPILSYKTIRNEIVLEWTSILGATRYVLQRSYNKSFQLPREIYSGEETRFTDKVFSPIFPSKIDTYLSESRYYRVKAEGVHSLSTQGNSWSNVIEVSQPFKRRPKINT